MGHEDESCKKICTGKVKSCKTNLACKAGKFCSAIHDLFSRIILSRYLGRFFLAFQDGGRDQGTSKFPLRWLDWNFQEVYLPTLTRSSVNTKSFGRSSTLKNVRTTTTTLSTTKGSEKQKTAQGRTENFVVVVSPAKNVYACAATKITWSIFAKVIGLEAKSTRNVVKMKEEMATYFVSGSDVVLLLLSETESYMGRNFQSYVLSRR